MRKEKFIAKLVNMGTEIIADNLILCIAMVKKFTNDSNVKWENAVIFNQEHKVVDILWYHKELLNNQWKRKSEC